MNFQNEKSRIFDAIIYDEPCENINLFEEVKTKNKQNCNTRKFRKIACIIFGSVCFFATANFVLADPIGRELTVVPTFASTEELIKETTIYNHHLEDSERFFLQKFTSYVNENPYLKEKDIYYDLKNFTINYQYKEGHILGLFHPCLLKVSIFNSENNENLLENKTVVGHELFHLLSCSGISIGFMNGSNLGLGLTEGMTQILTEEYINGNADACTLTYQKQTILVKFLCELIGADTMLYGYSTHNIDIVIEKLGALDNNPEKARRLIKLLDQMTKEQVKNKEVSNEILEEIYTILSGYYLMIEREYEQSLHNNHIIPFQTHSDVLPNYVELLYDNPQIHDLYAKKAILFYFLDYFCPESEGRKVSYYSLQKAYFSEELKQNMIPCLYDKMTALRLANDMPIGEMAQIGNQKTKTIKL